MLYDEYAVRTKQEKLAGETRVEINKKNRIIMAFLKYLWIHDKFSSTGFKQRLPAEIHGNNSLIIIIFPHNLAQ